MMIVNLKRTGHANAEPRATGRTTQRTASAGGTAVGHANAEIQERCKTMRHAVRLMLKLASETAFDLWSGYTSSAYLDEFEAAHREQLEAFEELKRVQSQADLCFLTRKAEMAFAAFVEAVRREVVGAVGPAMTEADFRAMLGGIKDDAVNASETIGLIQNAAPNC